MRLETAHQLREVCRRPECKVWLGEGGPVRLAEPPALAGHFGIRCNLADIRRVASAINRRQRRGFIRIKVSDSARKVRVVVAVIIPLTVRLRVRRVDRAINQWDERWQRVSGGEVRDRNQYNTATALRLMSDQFTRHDAAPIVAYPNGGPATEMVVKLCHVGHDVFKGVRLRGRGCRRTTITAHVGCNAVPALCRECLDLCAPDQAELRPTVQEQHQWPIGRSHLYIVRRMARGIENTRGQLGSGHSLSSCYVG
jgi:hypothetical protein